MDEELEKTKFYAYNVIGLLSAKVDYLYCSESVVCSENLKITDGFVIYSDEQIYNI